jgi:arylsulfatase
MLFSIVPIETQEIIHDTEYYILEAKHGEKWANQDMELQDKLDKLQKKCGTPPNIVHIM